MLEVLASWSGFFGFFVGWGFFGLGVFFSSKKDYQQIPEKNLDSVKLP